MVSRLLAVPFWIVDRERMHEIAESASNSVVKLERGEKKIREETEPRIEAELLFI